MAPVFHGVTHAEHLALKRGASLADGHVHDGEITALTELMKEIDFDSNFIMQARNIDREQAISILRVTMTSYLSRYLFTKMR